MHGDRPRGGDAVAHAVALIELVPQSLDCNVRNPDL